MTIIDETTAKLLFRFNDGGDSGNSNSNSNAADMLATTILTAWPAQPSRASTSSAAVVS